MTAEPSRLRIGVAPRSPERSRTSAMGRPRPFGQPATCRSAHRAGAIEMDTLVKPVPAEAMRERSVGERTPLIDGIEKVTGRARYTADLPVGEALVGRILRSPVAHGLIRGIDTARARALPGVRAIVT